MSRGIILIGGGGHAKVIAECLRCRGENILGYIDDRDTAIPGISRIRTIRGLEDAVPELNASYIVAIGDNQTRRNLVQSLAGYQYSRAIHPRAAVADDAALRSGTVVMANASINSGVMIGRHVIINTNASVDHDCMIGDFVHISPGAHLAGGIIVQEGVHIGIGAVVLPGVQIGRGAKVGAGAVVTKDVLPNATVVGAPAKAVR